jgi:DNA-binding response OmpR family regulator
VGTILVVEDNEQIREAVSSYLRLDNHEVIEFGRLHGVEEAVRMKSPDLLILDVMLPDGDGFQFARRLRAGRSVPILFLTARSSESDRITGFEVGGDDYVVKPFSPRELALRVRSILRRSGEARASASTGTWRLGSSVLTMDQAGHRAAVDGRKLSLTAAEWEILRLLAGSPEVVFSRERILGSSLDYVAEGSERTVDTHVKNIRSKLGDSGWIETVRGYGYRFAGRPAPPGNGKQGGAA